MILNKPELTYINNILLILFKPLRKLKLIIINAKTTNTKCYQDFLTLKSIQSMI